MTIRLQASVLSLLVLTGGMAGLLRAQHADTLLVQGTRVRVSVPSLQLTAHQGTVQALQGDTVAIALRQQGKWPVLGALGETVAVPLDSIAKLEVFSGRRGHPWRGALYGLLVGGVGGAAVGLVACEDYQVGVNGNCFDSNDGGQIAFWGPLGIGVLAGPILGAVIGALIKTDNWDEVPLDGLRVTIVPRDGGAGIGVSLRF